MQRHSATGPAHSPRSVWALQQKHARRPMGVSDCTITASSTTPCGIMPHPSMTHAHAHAP